MTDIVLTELEIAEIQSLAIKLRSQAGLDSGAVGRKIFEILRDNKVEVLFFSLPKKVSVNILGLYLKTNHVHKSKSRDYIALNATVPSDELVFNACHEYYHFVTGETQEFSITRTGNNEDRCERKANRFAAEFLIPTNVLELHIKRNNFGMLDLNNMSMISLYRIIASLTIRYQAAFVTVIKRLKEINSINDELFKKLLEVKSRNESSLYYRIASNLGGSEFELLNKELRIKGKLESSFIMKILDNYDNGIIGVDTLQSDLAIFGLNKNDFGYEEEDLDLDDDIEGVFELDESNST